MHCSLERMTSLLLFQSSEKSLTWKGAYKFINLKQYNITKDIPDVCGLKYDFTKKNLKNIAMFFENHSDLTFFLSIIVYQRNSIIWF